MNQAVLRWLMVATAVALAIAWWSESRVPKNQQPHEHCLTNGDCLSAESCLVIPKGDGFATSGLCLDQCEDDLQCPQGVRCEQFEAEKSYLRPESGKPTGTKKGVCVPGARD